ncbi:MAG: alkaline phosphatase PhoX, partial [Acidimicrobiales bacterium]
MDRRAFLRRVAALAGAAAVGPHLLRSASVGAAVVAGPGPYGALQAANGDGIQLPAGFTSRVIATAGQPVAGTGHTWHGSPDGGACFPATGGGWIYVSNSERGGSTGGASAVRFATDGSIAAAYTILSGTNANCAGGATPWGTWLSCEENLGIGRVYECDPQQPGQGVQRPLLGTFTHEAAAVDPITGHVYLTEDDPSGRLYRFAPVTPGDLTAGTLQAASVSGTSVSWVPVSTTSPERSASTTAFNGGEGEWISDRTLWFTTKGDSRVWELDLDTQQLVVLYAFATTPGGALSGVDNLTVHELSGDIFVAEDGGNMEVCIIGSVAGQDTVAPFLRFVGHDTSEVTGPAFSPDGTRLYVSSQRGSTGTTGVTYEITGPFRTAAPPPTVVTVPISVDSYVRDGTYASSTFGAATTLQICRSTSASSNRISYFQLDTTGVTDAVASATLRLWCRGTTTTATTVQVFGVGAPWSEDAVTWATRPALGAVVGSFALTNATYGWKEIDLTAY